MDNFPVPNEFLIPNIPERFLSDITYMEDILIGEAALEKKLNAQHKVITIRHRDITYLPVWMHDAWPALHNPGIFKMYKDRKDLQFRVRFIQTETFRIAVIRRKWLSSTDFIVGPYNDTE